MQLIKTTNQWRKITFALAFSCICFTACKKDDPITTPPTAKPNITFYGLSDKNQIIRYNANNATTPEATMAVAGLPTGESLVSIDFRPATGQLYALGATSRLYVINLNTGTATPLGTSTFTPALNSSVAGIDFNPTVDRIRLVTNLGQNLRLHPETGAVAVTDGNINGGASPSITGIAYTNSVAGATATDLFDIDASTKKLYKQSPPNDGTLVEVGALNVDFTGKAGFDINEDNSQILATLNVAGTTKLYTINTTNAATTFVSNIAETIVDIAIPSSPVAYAISEAGMFQIFNPTRVNSVVSKSISGIAIGNTLMGIDFRPANGQLYGLAVNTLGMAQLYSFNLSSGAATAVGTGFAIDASTGAIGFDFNPLVDRIRLVTNTGQNLRLNPNDGTLAATDGSLNPGTPTIYGAAYTNNFAGTTTTALYVMDADKLYKQDPPNAGTLTAIGGLGITADSQGGFDIGGKTNNAYALVTIGGATIVYNINTATGAATAGISYPNKVKGLTVGLGF